MAISNVQATNICKSTHIHYHQKHISSKPSTPRTQNPSKSQKPQNPNTNPKNKLKNPITNIFKPISSNI